MSKSARKSTKKKVAPKAKKLEQVAKSTSETVINKLEKKEKSVEAIKTPLKYPLRRWHVWLAVLFLAQAAIILLLSKGHSVPIITNYIASNPLTSEHELVPAFRSLFDVNLVYVVVAMLGLVGIGYLVAATVYRNYYESELIARASYLKWVIGGTAGSLLFIAAALSVGVCDLSSLLMIIGLTIVLHALGYFIESRQLIKTHGKLALFIAIIPWVVFALYIIGAALYGMHHLPGYVYGVILTLLMMLIAYGVNFCFQQTKRGRWANYIFGEKIHLIISIVGYSAIAWLLFGGVLQP
jgi:hypothetical protein